MGFGQQGLTQRDMIYFDYIQTSVFAQVGPETVEITDPVFVQENRETRCKFCETTFLGRPF